MYISCRQVHLSHLLKVSPKFKPTFVCLFLFVSFENINAVRRRSYISSTSTHHVHVIPNKTELRPAPASHRKSTIAKLKCIYQPRHMTRSRPTATMLLPRCCHCHCLRLAAPLPIPCLTAHSTLPEVSGLYTYQSPTKERFEAFNITSSFIGAWWVKVDSGIRRKNVRSAWALTRDAQCGNAHVCQSAVVSPATI